MKRLIGLMMIAVAGCAAPRGAKPVATAAPPPALDRCADHLQDICGIILEYYVDNRQLPATLEQLQAIAVQENEPSDLFVCPVSKLRYIYNPDGIALPGFNPPARLVMCDAAAVHDGHRWGIAISTPMGGHPLICRVVMPPDNMVLSPPSETGPGK
jgi:hypothetical protein